MSDWRAFLTEAEDEGIQDVISPHERTGRPLGANSFFDRLQKVIGKDVRPQKNWAEEENRYGVPLILFRFETTGPVVSSLD